MVSTSTPWTVRTTKRKLPTSAPNPRKRHRSSDHVKDGRTSVPRKPRQQTLTQIQFIQHRSQDDEDDILRPTAAVPKEVPAEQNGVRLQQRSSTLTQMDFLARPAIQDTQDDGLTPLPVDSNIEVGLVEDGKQPSIHLDGPRDGPNARRRRGAQEMGRATLKRKGTSVVLQDSQEFTPIQKKSKIDSGAVDTVDHDRRTLSRMASGRATRSTRLLSARHAEEDENVNSCQSVTVNEVVQRPPNPQYQRQELSRLPLNQENRPSVQQKLPETAFMRTPSKRKNAVPSSQSPESLLPSTQKTTGPVRVSHRLLIERSPLKERSVNAQLSRQKKNSQTLSANLVERLSPQKQKICVLKLSSHTLHQRQALGGHGKVLSQNSVWSPPSSSSRIAVSGKVQLEAVLENRDGTGDLKLQTHTEELPAAPLPEIKDSLEGTELEVSRVSEDNPEVALSSSASVLKTEATLPNPRRLHGLKDVPGETITLHGVKDQQQLRHWGIKVKDFATDNTQWLARQSQRASLEDNGPPTADSKDALHVADTEEEVASVCVLSPGSSIANDTQFNAELAERILTSTTEASPATSATPGPRRPFPQSPTLSRESKLSLRSPSLVNQLSYYYTTTAAPLSCSPPSSSLPPPSTQCSLHPPSLPHPSQVSTQDSTQAYLPLSSIPPAPTSSPVRCGPATITIKDSSSVTKSLCDVPSYRHLESEATSRTNADLGLDDCLDVEDDDGLTEALLTTSDQVDDDSSRIGDSQVVPLPLQTSHSRDQAIERSRTTEQGSPVRRRQRPRKPFVPPEVRAVLGESILESVPGPPGWSQSSWDDELL